MSYVLVTYYSRYGATKELAEYIGRGVESADVEAKVLPVAPLDQESLKEAESEGVVFATVDDLANSAGFALGSPTRFGLMAAALKHFIDQTGKVWMESKLVDKPAAVFTSTSSMHGGQEATLFNLATPILHWGSYLIGVPYTVDELNSTVTGGTPYGPSHFAGPNNSNDVSKEEHKICFAMGKRLGEHAKLFMNRKSILG